MLMHQLCGKITSHNFEHDFAVKVLTAIQLKYVFLLVCNCNGSLLGNRLIINADGGNCFYVS